MYVDLGRFICTIPVLILTKTVRILMWRALPKTQRRFLTSLFTAHVMILPLPPPYSSNDRLSIVTNLQKYSFFVSILPLAIHGRSAIPPTCRYSYGSGSGSIVTGAVAHCNNGLWSFWYRTPHKKDPNFLGPIRCNRFFLI